MAANVLTGLAVLQGLFFLLPIASAMPRLIAVALTLATFLARRVLHEPPMRVTALAGIAVLIAANFAFHLVQSAPQYPFRLWQVTVLFLYAATGLAGLVSVVGVKFRSALIGFAAVAGVLIVIEAATSEPEDFSPTRGSVTWTGDALSDSSMGVRYRPNSIVKTMYPDNPRGYFDEPDALQRRWSLLVQQGSMARLVFPPEKRGLIRVEIDSVPGHVGWHINLAQAPLRLLADERYEVRFRARSDSARTLFVAMGQAHDPWNLLGLYREIRVDSTWRDFSETFRATGTDRVSRLYFDLGTERPAVELMNVTVRAISTDQEVQAEARRELSVSYRINGQGCRGTDIARPAPAGAWRILALGDGTTFGVGVHENDTFAHRLEALLNDNGPTTAHAGHVDVINCGVRGAAVKQTRQWYKIVGPQYAPNIVLLAVNADDDHLVSAARTKPNGTGAAERLLHVWRLLRGRGQARESSGPDASSVVSEIKALDAETKAQGARLVIVVLRHRTDDALTAVDSALAVTLRDGSIPLLRLDRALLAFGEQKLQVHTTYDPHPNELAHRVTAEALRKFLADQGLLSSGLRGATTVSDSSASPPE